MLPVMRRPRIKKVSDIVGKTGKHSGGSAEATVSMVEGKRIAAVAGRGPAIVASAAFVASAMAVTGMSATAFAATATSGGMVKKAAVRGAVASSRSFPSTREVHRSMAESASVTAASRSSSRKDSDADWGGIEKLEIPLSRSTDQKTAASSLQASIDNGDKKLADSDGKVADDATRTALKQAIDAGAAKLADLAVSVEDLSAAGSAIADASAKVDESMRAKQDADQAAAQRRAQQQAAASSSAGDYGFTYKAPEGQSSSDVVNYAMQFVGKVPYVWAGSSTSGWDCSGMTMFVFRHFGVNLPHYSGAQAGYGRAIGSLADAKPGDLVANGTHAAIYIGNGMVVNALNPSAGTTVTPINWAFSGGYSIRRIIE